MIPPNYSFFWGLVCVVPLKIGFVTFTFSPKRNVKMLFFLQINRRCCGFFLTMLPSRVISNALLFPFTLSQSIYPLSGYCLASLPIRIVPLNVPVKVDLSLPLPPPLLLVSPPLVLPPVPP